MTTPTGNELIKPESTGSSEAEAVLERLGLRLSIKDGTDRYAMYDELGRGAAGLVYFGLDKALHRQVAIKILRKRYLKDPASVAHFLNEAKIMAKLEHPGIVPVYDIGLMNKVELFFSMEKVEGCTLREVLDRRKDGEPVQKNLTELIRVFERICEIVAHAHSLGVVHRDLKPDNIMVGPFNTVFVMDWGIARDLQENERKSVMQEMSGKQINLTALLDGRKVKGTPRYMSPEQALGVSRVDLRSDVFSLGLILYEILNGAHPFESDSMRQILHDIKQTKTPPLTSYFITNDLKFICYKALAKLPADRYPNAGPLAEDISRSLSFQNVSVHKNNPIMWTWKLFRRHMLLSAASVFIMAVAGIMGYNWLSGMRYSNEMLEMAQQRMDNARQCQEMIDQLRRVDTKDKAYVVRKITEYKNWKEMNLISARGIFSAVLKKRADELENSDIKALKRAWFAELNYYMRLEVKTYQTMSDLNSRLKGGCKLTANEEGARKAFDEMDEGGFLQPDHPIMKWTATELDEIQRFRSYLDKQRRTAQLETEISGNRLNQQGTSVAVP